MQKLLIVIFIFFICSAAVSDKMNSRGKMNKKAPPGTVWLKDNLYIDRTEIRNVDYREYLYWLGRIFGNRSSKYIRAFPDTTVWNDSLRKNPFVYKYIHSPEYGNYPLTGITRQQAEDYCKWRSDRVNEWHLILEGILKPDTMQNSVSHFTTEGYLAGKYKKNLKDKYPGKEYTFCYYRLPSEEEWEYAAAGGLNVNEYGLGYKKITDSEGKVMLNVSNGIKEKKYPGDLLLPVRSYKPNKYGIYNMIGNAAEMLSEEGRSKGGSWLHTSGEGMISKSIDYEKHECWLGFRCVCEKKILK